MRQTVIKPPKSLLRQVGRAITDFRMIREGDRILLGVSGGKDSLSLLHVLRHLQTYAPVRFELGVLTVDPEVPGFAPQPLTTYYDALGVPWFYERQPILEQAKGHMDGDSFCAYCARMKRGIMYRVCRREAYGVLALAQHLDDLAESLLMSIFHGGQLRTMKAHYRNDAGDLRMRVRRPHESRISLVLQPDVIGITPGPGDEPLVFLALDGGADSFAHFMILPDRGSAR